MVGMIIMNNEQYYRPINSDKPEGVIRNPFAFYFPIQRGFSGTIKIYPLLTHQSRGGPTAHILKINAFCQSSEQIFLRKVELQIL